MRLIQFREPGPPAVMQCLEVPIPEPGPGEVLIRAHAIGVGMPDCLIRAGTYSVMPPLPATPGTELAGVIEKVGPTSDFAFLCKKSSEKWNMTCNWFGQKSRVTSKHTR
jgi:NADPH:quinone reductase